MAILAGSVLVALPALAWAAEDTEAGGGLPQLDASTYVSQIFWLVLAFGTLFWLLKTKGLPRIADILETRQERITADLDRAARLRADAEQALKRHEAVVAEAQRSAAERLKATSDKLAAAAAKRQAKHEAELAKKIAEAETRIGEARDQALGEIAEVAAEIAQAATGRLAGLEVSAKEARVAVQGLLREAHA
jgi:F-type H+-transporting ATPase subunit b